MRGRSTVNFLAETLFDCPAKVASWVGDSCGGIAVASRTVAPARQARGKGGESVLVMTNRTGWSEGPCCPEPVRWDRLTRE